MLGPFDKKKYWLARKSSVADKRTLRKLEKASHVISIHHEVDWPRKAVSVKAFRKNTKRARRFHAEKALAA